MIEDKIKLLKDEYQSIEAPGYLVSHGWLDLSLKLGDHHGFSWRLIFVRGLMFASVVLVLSGAVVGVSQAAKPGDLLFSVRAMSEKVAAKVVGNPDIIVVRRADDLIDQSKKDPQALDRASEEYTKALEQSKQDAQKSGNTQNFKQTLDKQEQKFTEAQKGDHSSSGLKKAVEETQKVNGEVKGEKDSGGRSSEEHNNGSGHSNDSENHGSGNSHGGDHGGN